MADNLQSPGPGWRYLHFSDGEGAWMNPKLTDQQWAQIKQQGEAERDAKYMAQAKAENRPITTQDKVYSATAVRPAGVHGQLMAWLDHHAGGNALNESSVGHAIQSASGAVGSGARIATSAIEAEPHVRAIDMGLTGLNVGKHVLANVVPGLDRVPDSQTILGLLRQATGTPELSPDASMGQRVLENAASAVAGARPSAPNTTSFFGRAPVTPGGFREQLLDATGHAALSHVGGLAGEELLGEPGQFAGSFLTPGGTRAIAQRTLAPLFRSKTTAQGRNTTEEVSGAATRQGVQPTLGSVSNDMGRLFAKGLAATPWVGARIKSAQERFNEAIRERQLDVAREVYGSDLPGNISDEDIGGALIAGGRQGAANITQRARDEQNRLAHDVGPGTGVQGRDVYWGPAGYQTRLSMDPGVYPAYKARLDNIRQAAIEAQQPAWQNFWGQLAHGEIPYQRFQEMRSNLGGTLAGFEGMSKGQQDQLYEAMTEAMRSAARVRGGQALVEQFDNANANYKRLIGEGGQRDQLEAISGKPQGGGGWDQFMGLNGQTRPTVGVEFAGGKDEQGAANWFKSKLRAPEALAPFADPTNVPNDFWRRTVGLWLASRGMTKEGTFRPDQMATEVGGDDNVRSNTGVGSQVQQQLFTSPTGTPTANIQDVNDIATLGRNAVVPVSRDGLANTAGIMYALKKAGDVASHVFGGAGGLALMGVAGRNLADPDFINAIRGQGTPLVNSLYAGVPAAVQNILQYQNNPPAAYDPLGYSVTPNQNPSQ
jgi:hypothetical protein